MQTKLPFDLPPIHSDSERPIWNGNNFLIGSNSIPLLEYSENFEGWSEDLTLLHETSAGDDHPIDIASREEAIDQIKNFKVNSDSVILEVGCSSGFLLKELKDSFPESLVIGADVVKEPLLKLANSMPGVPLIQFDLLQCPIPKNSIDVLVMLNVLEHIKDDNLALIRAFEILKPNGILIIEVPAGPWLYDAYDLELNHFRRYSSRDMKNKINNAGFRIINFTHLGFLVFPFFALFKLYNKFFYKKKNHSVVDENIKKTSKNIFMKYIMKIERKYLPQYKPFGIRLNVVVQKFNKI
tara:strand:+ start:468 stop:1355 length:888 start_codon:yes stop_codon:yes gene_type:complete